MSSVESIASRYGIYFAPAPGSALAEFGARCLGRDVETGANLPQPLIDGVTPDRWRSLTASPRRYGFHATLKAPFHLDPHRSRAELIDRLERFAFRQLPFDAPALRVSRIADFVALVPSAPSQDLAKLADHAVRDFDTFRAAPTEDELARRLPASLTARQRGLLTVWGYPFVFDEWRFHMTLATGLVSGELERVQPQLENLSRPSCGSPLHVGDICLFEQADEDAPFLVTHRFPLGRRSA